MRDVIIAAAVPGFLLLIVAELVVGKLRGFNTYRANDTVSSISCGILGQVCGVFTAFVGLGVYRIASEHLALFSLPANTWWTWAIALVGYDLCYYWSHRLGHEVNVLWASHVVHHSSEEYNLSTALRQTSTGFLFGWLFYWPLAVIGVPLTVFAIAGAVNLLYQYWIHTRHIGRLGWFDRWFASPSNHRVHHGQNDYCLDRNYGGMFMLWDRLFGTFVDERADEKIVYGIRGPLRSWSPVRANLHVYGELWRDCRLADTWKDRLKLWVAHPGWRPPAAERLGAGGSKKAPDLARFEKHDPPTPAPLVWYAFVQFALVAPLAVHFLVVHRRLPWQAALAYAAVLAASLWLVGGLLEARRPFVELELTRLTLLAVGVASTGRWFGEVALPGGWRWAALAIPVMSAVGLTVLARRLSLFDAGRRVIEPG